MLEDVTTRLRGEVITLDAADVVAIARGGEVMVMHRDRARMMLTLFGGIQLLDEIEAARLDRDSHDVPLVICLDKYMCCAWISVVSLTPGGDA